MRRALLLAALVSAGCAQLQMKNPFDQAQKSIAAATGNKECTRAELEKYAYSPDDEYWFGRSVADRLIAGFTQQNPDAVYPPDSPAAVYVNEVGQLAAEAAERNRDDGGGPSGAARRFPGWARVDDMPDRPPPEFGYRFILVRNPAPGAWGLPGGFIILTDSLVARAGSEDQLAGILAHEVAHVQRGHGIEVIKKVMCAQEDSAVKEVAKQAGDTAASVKIVDLGPVVESLNKFADRLSDALTDKGYGINYEYEADAYGTRYLATEGYSAAGIADFLHRVDADPAFSTAMSKSHPPAHLRAEAIEKQVAAEKLEPARSPHERERVSRFVKAMIAGGIRPDWSPKTDPATAPLVPPAKTASAN